jgi:hypothetical protein
MDLNNFSPFPKKPNIARVFKETGLADELGSGVRNLLKYVGIYSNGKPQLFDEDVFKLIVPIPDYTYGSNEPVKPNAFEKKMLVEIRKSVISREKAPTDRGNGLLSINKGVKMKMPTIDIDKKSYLKDCLTKLNKNQLLLLAENHHCAIAKNTKKDQIVEILKKHIQKAFLNSLKYMNASQIFFIVGMLKEMLDTHMIEVLPENLPEFEGDYMKISMYDFNILLDLGYTFYNKNKDPIIPADLLMLYTKFIARTNFDITKYQQLQLIIKGCINFYGYCTVSQVLKVFNKFTRSTMKHAEIEDYIIGFNQFREDFIVYPEDGFLYHYDIDVDDFELFMLTDPDQNYYIPNEKELEDYYFSITCQKAKKTVKRLYNFILSHGCFEEYYINEDDEEESVDIHLFSTIITEKLLLAAKLGQGIYKALEIIEERVCSFSSSTDLHQFYSLYRELDRNTRKWILKGRFLSEV